ncbi:hypothetical protein T484DRAFT_1804050 [Baffinella frigidus]|nr:hypothetical protein T484DRAFT_1804050 [Cryptophyta sp. CCMP2293]
MLFARLNGGLFVTAGSPERLILGRTEEGDEEDGSLDESFADEDTEHSQILRQHRARDLGRLFAQNIVFEKKTEDVELRAVVRGQKHETVTRARHDELARRFEVEREADQQKIQKLQTRKAAQLRTKEDQAHANWEKIEESWRDNWEKIEEVATRVVTQRNDAAKFLADTREERRAERRKQLGEMRAEAERREGDLKKKVKMLDNHRKTVVAELYMDYMRTGHLAKPTGLVDLDGDALPAVLEIAAKKSTIQISPMMS